jgi:tyrosyl-tRNA synthetase
MQAFDSVVIDADVELGGTEQLYSFMLARDLQKDPGVCRQAQAFRPAGVPPVEVTERAQRQQLGVMSPILVGTDGVRRMGKSLGNYIGISEDPYEMTKKFMQLPDAVMRVYFELLTDAPLAEIDALLAGHPKAAKVDLGRRIVSEYHSAAAAEAAAQRWQREIGEGALPSDMPEVSLRRSQLDAAGCLPAANLLKELGLVPSTSEAGNRIQGGAAWILVDGVRRELRDRREPVPVTPGMIVRAGKKDWCTVQIVDG